MKIYLAPLENITTMTYRNTLAELFGDSINAYFMPFMMPHIKIRLDEKDRRELSKDRNIAPNMIPQILTNDSEGFWRMAEGMVEMGYQEININIGCPSHKVASKGRGSGLLKYLDKMDRFLDEVFEKNKGRIDISVKTRIGRNHPEEFYEILPIYNQYPLKELIVHPRTGIERYGGIPRKDYFIYALKNSKNPVCYNGNIYTVEEYKELVDLMEEHGFVAEDHMTGVMLGRGLLGNPALGREINGGAKITGQEMQAFMDLYRDNCRKLPRLGDSKTLLNKSKEIFSFIKYQYPQRQEELRQIFLCQDFKDYLELERRFFENL